MYPDDVVRHAPWDGQHTQGRIDVARTRLHERFFSRFPTAGEDLLHAVASLDVDVDAVAADADAWEVYGGWVYWALFVTGFLQYDRDGSLEASNSYLSYMLRYYGPRGHDPGLHDVMSVPEIATQRIGLRFQDFRLFREHANQDSIPVELVAPVTVMIPDSGPALLEVYDVDVEVPAKAALIDGWHRLFAASVWGIRTLPAEYFYFRLGEDPWAR